MHLSADEYRTLMIEIHAQLVRFVVRGSMTSDEAAIIAEAHAQALLRKIAQS